jgi:hypothetical protein
MFIGDYNYDMLEWTTCLAGLNLSPSSRRSVQYVIAKIGHANKSSPKRGDTAVAINSQIFQERVPSGSVKAMALSKFSDGHALVVVPIKVKACRLLTEHAAQSIAEWIEDLPAEALTLNIPNSTTPRYGQLLDNLANHTDVANQYPANFLDNLTSKLLLWSTIPKGMSSEAARDPAQRIEHVLAVVEGIRSAHLHKANAAQAGPNDNDKIKALTTWQRRSLHRQVFTDDDMMKAFKTWQNNPKDWMDERTLQALECDPKLTPAKRHNKLHSAFGTMQFQLLGNKHLIHHFIKYPVHNADQPAHAIQAFLDKWADHS